MRVLLDKIGLSNRRSQIISFYLCIFACCALFMPDFLIVDGSISLFKLNTLMLSASTFGMLSCTMLFCLAMGEFDLSIGAIAACSSVITALTINATSNIALAIFVALLFGAVVGLVNGFVISRFRVNSLLVTLITMQVVRAIAYVMSSGGAIGILDDSFYKLGAGYFMGISHPVLIFFVVLFALGFLFHYTTIGRDALAIGGDEQAARLIGVYVNDIRIVIFVMQGLVASVVGVIMASRMQLGYPSAAQGLELQVIAVCVLGGTSLAGGVGSMYFVFCGIIMMAVIENVMNLFAVDYYYQWAIRGVILLLAIVIGQYMRRR